MDSGLPTGQAGSEAGTARKMKIKNAEKFYQTIQSSRGNLFKN